MQPKIVAVFICSLMLWSCSDNEPETLQKIDWTQEQSIAMNSTFSGEENEQIDGFLSRRPDWRMSKTGSGLRYFIYDSTNNQQAQAGQIVWVNFTISLLDNTICYTSKRGEPESYMIEKSDIESGIHEGLKLMAEGEKAKFILPSHLAHGLIGDLDQIPPLEPVVYDIELVKIATPNE